ncbi:MAG: GTPase Era [Bacteroidota bacterium]|nr:GTPase Era [Bacteroidota bacterium]MDP4233775.1 GTPase Era [Bacteroidota bacterium]MDP4242414.1 GTPase Era [Bacteroidota bacterium]MDP4287536.1 GTPase Era [Bacteroidota bacterium]
MFDFRTGYCAIVGIPNAGKSTLMNALLGTKLSIVSRKPQTTRKRVLGIFSSETEQMVFLDTPGIMPRPNTLLHKAMLEEVKRSFADADVILVLAEAHKPFDSALPGNWDEYKRIAGTKPIILAISKIDLSKKRTDLLPVLQHYGEQTEFTEIVPISSLKKSNLPELVKTLRKYLPVAEPFYDTEQLSDQNDRFFVGELVREVIFQKYKEEIPYSTEVEVREFKERENGKWFVSADVVVERDSQKAILVGRGGLALKSLGEQARKEIERFLTHPVFLELHVKTRADWRDNKRSLAELGYRT